MNQPTYTTVGEGIDLAVYPRRVATAAPDSPIGPARAFVLVHGLASNAAMWTGVADHLASLGHESYAVDLRGHGRSSKPDAGYGTESVADDLSALVERLGIDRPVVAGQSWGGNVVLALAERHPSLVAGVACVDGGVIDLGARFATWAECEAQLAPPALAGMAASRLEAMMRVGHPDWPESGIAGAMANFEIAPDGTIRPWLTRQRHLLILRSLWEDAPTKRYPNVAAPVLLLPAEGRLEAAWTSDKRAAVAQAEALLAHCRTIWTTGDHDLHAQHPGHIAELLHTASVDGFFR